MGSRARGFKRAWPQARGLNLKKKEAGTRRGLILNQDGASGAWFEAEKTTEAGTRPEHLSSTNMGCQVHGFKLRRRRRRGRGRSACPQPRWGFRWVMLARNSEGSISGGPGSRVGSSRRVQGIMKVRKTRPGSYSLPSREPT